MRKDQSVETAVKLAVLKTPEAFGLRPEDVNPLLQFVLIGAEDSVPKDGLEDVIRQCQFECVKAVNAKVRQILSGKAAEAIISENVVGEDDDSEIVDFEDEDDAESEPVPARPQSKNVKGNSKRNGSNGGSAAKPSQRKSRPSTGASAYGEPKVSVKQLRYIGYLLRQMDEEPDYKAIADLTQKQATQRIRELEGELANK